jgi:hypothetical protein
MISNDERILDEVAMKEIKVLLGEADASVDRSSIGLLDRNDLAVLVTRLTTSVRHLLAKCEQLDQKCDLVSRDLEVAISEVDGKAPAVLEEYLRAGPNSLPA